MLHPESGSLQYVYIAAKGCASPRGCDSHVKGSYLRREPSLSPTVCAERPGQGILGELGPAPLAMLHHRGLSGVDMLPSTLPRTTHGQAGTHHTYVELSTSTRSTIWLVRGSPSPKRHSDASGMDSCWERRGHVEQIPGSGTWTNLVKPSTLAVTDV